MKNIHKLNGFIYVTSEEEIKKGDWFKTPANDVICANIEWVIAISKFTPKHGFKKVILTNDPKLTTVQQLTHEEEAYCKTVDSVEVEKEFQQTADNLRDGFYYQLQLPKQETIEEVAYNYAKNKTNRTSHLIGFREGYNHAVKTLYTEEEVRLMLSESFKASHEGYYYGIENALRILRNLKPKEREMLEGVWFDANQEEAKDNGNYHASKYFDANLTQE